jgi:hypothetical protein
MIVHLLRSEEFSSEKYWEIVEFLRCHDGPIKFVASENKIDFRQEQMNEILVDQENFYTQMDYSCHSEVIANFIPEKRTEITWNSIFKKSKKYRSERYIPKSDWVIILTDYANENNWFSMMDPDNPKNGFVHTGEWEYYVNCPEVYPVSYLIASKLLQGQMFSSFKELTESYHHEPLGCMNDFCKHKKQIILKLRTADICHDCIELLRKKGIDISVIQQVLTIFESVRLRMLFAQNFKQNLKPSRLKISENNKIFLVDYDNIEIKLTPLEKTVFLLFLNHPEGIFLHNLSDHKTEIFNIYGELSGSGMLTEIHNRIESLVDITSNSASEKIAKIKIAFVKAIGKDLAANYYIQGGNAEAKKILIDRNLISTN